MNEPAGAEGSAKRTLADFAFNLMTIPIRLRHRWKNRKRLSTSRKLQKTFKNNIEKARTYRLPTYEGVFNVGLFIAIAEQDLSTYAESILHGRSQWHRKFHARGLAVLLYELAEDLPELLGKNYRKWLIELGLGDEWLDRLNAITKSIAAFRRAHEPFLLKVRNYVGAHRDHDAYAQLEVLEGLDVLEVFGLAPLLSSPLDQLVVFNIDLNRYLSKYNVILAQMARAER
ncbi:hypothetical protein ACIPRI_11275 [Variovorax sp. LARHSF232]